MFCATTTYCKETLGWNTYEKFCYEKCPAGTRSVAKECVPFAIEA